MAKKHYRKNKTCLNCNYVVENKFCPNCGQENNEQHKSFHHLFFHFFEDLTHYENSFWRTIRLLLFKPAVLTKEYLAGKRMTYLAPVRLYIFVSFATFLIIAILPKGSEIVKINQEKEKKSSGNSKENFLSLQELKIKDFEKKGLITAADSDSLLLFVKKSKELENKNGRERYMIASPYKSLKELDSIEAAAKPEDKMNFLEKYFSRKMAKTQEELTAKEFNQKFKDNFKQNIPKALFVYMPLFAFILWLFQSKKKWYYFDHGIFTLHYFSFLLLATLLLFVWDNIFNYLPDSLFYKILNYSIQGIATLFAIYYFFPAHHRFYQESRWISFFKGSVMFFINVILISFILTFFAFYTLLNLH